MQGAVVSRALVALWVVLVVWIAALGYTVWAQLIHPLQAALQ